MSPAAPAHWPRRVLMPRHRYHSGPGRRHASSVRCRICDALAVYFADPTMEAMSKFLADNKSLSAEYEVNSNRRSKRLHLADFERTTEDGFVAGNVSELQPRPYVTGVQVRFDGIVRRCRAPRWRLAVQ